MLRELTRLNARLDAALNQFAEPKGDTFKAVWRHYYKKAKKTGGHLDKMGGVFKKGSYGQELPDGNRELRHGAGLLWRGTHRGEVEKIAKGRFKSEWTNPNHPGKKRTYVAGGPGKTEMYAGTAAAHEGNRGALNGSRSLIPDGDTHRRILEHLPNARIMGISPKALKRADHRVRGTVGDYAQTAPLRGGVAAREVRMLLKPRALKPGAKEVKWNPVPLGDVLQRRFERG
jgi:hypothetical protein